MKILNVLNYITYWHKDEGVTNIQQQQQKTPRDGIE